jgi:hypothetical protein
LLKIAFLESGSQAQTIGICGNFYRELCGAGSVEESSGDQLRLGHIGKQRGFRSFGSEWRF